MYSKKKTTGTSYKVMIMIFDANLKGIKLKQVDIAKKINVTPQRVNDIFRHLRRRGVKC